MLAADTRVTQYLLGLRLGHSDDHEKVQRTGAGIITGAGFVPLLTAVKKRFLTDPMLSTNDALRIMREERGKVITAPETTGSTGWIFTYPTVIGQDSVLRLGLVHPSIAGGKEIAIYEAGNAALIPPFEAATDQAEAMRNLILKMMPPAFPMDKLGDQQLLSEHFAKSWRLVALLIKGASPLFGSISDKIQVGVHLLGDLRGVSGIYSSDAPTISFSLSR